MTRQALVLGVGGFLGSHLARGLLADGWGVTGVTRDVRAPYLRPRLADLAADLRLVEGDAADADLLGRLTADVDAVYPFAGSSGAERSLHHPDADLRANAGAQIALLEALRVNGSAAHVVFPGSRLQYGRTRTLPVPEHHPCLPRSPYGISKLAGEHYHRLYHDIHGVQTCCLRISNPYGPHQDRPDEAFGVVGTFLGMAARSETIPLFGGGAQLRDYVHVEDLVGLFILAATHPAAVGGVFNAGGSRGVMLREMAEAVVQTVGRGRIAEAPWEAGAAAVETGDYVSDVSHVRETLGWSASRDLLDGLADTWRVLEPTLKVVP